MKEQEGTKKLIEEIEEEEAKQQVLILLQAACNFQGMSLASREKCRNEYRLKESDAEFTLRVLIDGQISLIAEKTRDKIDVINPETSYQIGLLTSFIRTHFLICDFILNGDLLDAIILMRKQLESLARLYELDSTPCQELYKKVPNIKNISRGKAGRIYGDFSEIAHFSTPQVTEFLHIIQEGDLVGPSLLPLYSEKSGACFDVNCFVAIQFLIWINKKLPKWYSTYDDTENDKLFLKTIVSARRLGIISFIDESIKS